MLYFTNIFTRIILIINDELLKFNKITEKTHERRRNVGAFHRHAVEFYNRKHLNAFE